MTLLVKRRSFLKAATAGTVSLFVGCDEQGDITGGTAGQTSTTDGTASDGDPGHRLVTWVRITSDNTVHIAMQKAEMGQGVHTSLPLIVAEELDVSVSQIRVEVVPEIAPYSLNTGPLMTYGSTSVSRAYFPFRKVGAAARAVLVEAASLRWAIAPGDITTVDGICIAPDGRELAYSELVEEAAGLTPPDEPPLKDPATFRLIGQDQERSIDEAIVNGTAVYGIDAARPDGLYAAIRHAPTRGGVPTNVETLTSDDPGVEAIVALPNAVAVVADSFWTANKIVKKLDVTFETPERELQVSSEGIRADLIAGLDAPGVQVEKIGDVDAALPDADQTLTVEYHAPHIAHVPMAPVNATVHVTDTSCEFWLPTQAPASVRTMVKEVTGLASDQIAIHPMLLGGSFGRKGKPDYAEAALRIAQAVDRPVTLIWSREEDIRRDHFRPAFACRLTGALDEAGDLTAWDAANCGDSVLGLGQSDPLSADGLSTLPYAIPHQRCRHVFMPSPVQSGFWRSIGHSQNTFFVESFLDEMAHLAGRDPAEMRLAMLEDNPRVKACVERVVELGQWGDPMVPGAGQGIAICHDYGSTVVAICEASVDPETLAVTVHRYTAVVDCGVVIQPDGVHAQIEGGLMFGLSAALHEEVTFEGGRTEQSNLHNYRILQPSEAPVVTVDILESAEDPGGVGELSVGVAAPALVNAVFAATGIRCRTLPLAPNLAEAS